MRERQVVVVGGGNSAGQAALNLAEYADRVTLVTRSDSLRRTMSDYLVRELRATSNVHVRVNTTLLDGRGTRRLEALTLQDCANEKVDEIAADALFVLIGAEPHTDWLPAELARDERGFLLTGDDLGRRADWPRERAPFPFETSVPGVFAAGDVRSGSVQRVASAAGAGAITSRFVHAYLEKTPLHAIRAVS